jgi:lincosamide nucleotidyltransferase A/C/D/E
VTEFAMPPQTARTLVATLEEHGVAVCVGGGWCIDALVGRRTRDHADLDVWVDAAETEPLFAALAGQGIDRIHPWPGDRPWNFVLHDGGTLRVDLHLYETLADGRLHYGSVVAPFTFSEEDLAGRGVIADRLVRCETPAFALRNHTGYDLRDVDRHDVPVLCEHFGLALPDAYLT